jgi:hypothetical protein
VVVRGPSCILEGALRFATAQFEEGKDRWRIVRETLTHAVDIGDSPCTWEEPTDVQIQYQNVQNSLNRLKQKRNLRDRKDTPEQSGTTVIEASFLFDPDKQGRSDGELWLHENCGGRPSAEHDLGRIVISENEISGMRSRIKMLKVKLDISEEGLLCRKPVLEMVCPDPKTTSWRWNQMPITWEGSNLSLSNNNRMDNVRVQLADEMKTFHHQHNLTVDGN